MLPLLLLPKLAGEPELRKEEVDDMPLVDPKPGVELVVGDRIGAAAVVFLIGVALGDQLRPSASADNYTYMLVNIPFIPLSHVYLPCHDKELHMLSDTFHAWTWCLSNQVETRRNPWPFCCHPSFCDPFC